MGWVLAPYAEIFAKVPGASLQTTEISEGFFTFMKFDLVVGLFCASPLVLFEIWGFVARGLYDQEKRVVRIVAPISAFLFVCGTLFYYLVIQPPALEFLMTNWVEIPLPFGGSIPIRPAPRLDNAFGFYLTMSLVLGLTFELPLGMVAAQKLGVVTWRNFAKYRKHFFMGSLVAMAILTPSGDAITLALCMVPVLFLFEGGIVVCRIMQPDAPKDDDEDEDDR
jgi:sec-independent protein translocase protein TatC